MAAFRIVVTNTKTGETYEWMATRVPLTIGRAEGCDVVLEDPTVSKLHATIDVVGGELVVVDGGSRNGIWFSDRGARVDGRVGLKAVDYRIFVGPFVLDVVPEAASSTIVISGKPGGSVTVRYAKSGVDPASLEVAAALREVDSLYTSYRDAWRNLHELICERLDQLGDAGSRLAFLSRVSNAHPLVAAQPEFTKLLEAAQDALSDPAASLRSEWAASGRNGIRSLAVTRASDEG